MQQLTLFDNLSQLVIVFEILLITWFVHKEKLGFFEVNGLLILIAVVLVFLLVVTPFAGDHCRMIDYLLVYDRQCFAPIIGSIYALIICNILLLIYRWRQ
jgi:hypothetical protein